MMQCSDVTVTPLAEATYMFIEPQHIISRDYPNFEYWCKTYTAKVDCVFETFHPFSRTSADNNGFGVVWIPRQTVIEKLYVNLKLW
jgi:hypothetical protein